MEAVSGSSSVHPTCALLPSDCEPGRVHVTTELCQKGLVPPCPPSCLDPEGNRSCSGRCEEGEAESERESKRCAPRPGTLLSDCSFPGCRCAPGLLLQDSHCLPLSECPCLVGQDLRQPRLAFLLDNCSRW